jgi:hypothetical protein
MGFLRKAGNYNLQEALSICDKKELYRATVFLYGRNCIFIFRNNIIAFDRTRR